MIPGHATSDGTAAFAARFPGPSAHGFYRNVQGLSASSLGLGTYLGAMDESTDRGYIESVKAAIGGGVNFIDTSLNYRHQRSERNIGAAIQEMIRGGRRREEFVVCTKAGYLVPEAVPFGLLRREDVAGGIHSMAPAFLTDQLERSRANLGLETIDVLYLHNPEAQLEYVRDEEFHARIERAFNALESLAAEGRIRYYGTATWNGYRAPAGEGLSLPRLVEIARRTGGESHRFRFVQLPFNLAMVEAFTRKPSVLEAAHEHGITVVASASLLQARLASDVPEEVRRRLPGPVTDAQCALQFARSAPGIDVALAGMSSPEHVRENLGVAAFSPASREEFLRLFQ